MPFRRSRGVDPNLARAPRHEKYMLRCDLSVSRTRPVSVCSCRGVSEKHILPGLGRKDALKVDRDTFFWDSELAGFGVRVHPTGRKVYVVQTRAGGEAAKRVTVGRHGVITAEEARRRAAQIIARIKAGEDPVPEPMAVKLAAGPTVGELARRYLEEHVAVRCKPKTEATYGLIVEKHILPPPGKMPGPRSGTPERRRFRIGRLCARPVMAGQVVGALARVCGAAGAEGGRGGARSEPGGGELG